MTYQQATEYLFSQLPMFSKLGAAAYKADLTNTIKICNFLDQPQQKFKSIHVAGTNGKGSTSHMLAAIFQASGYKTGLYTSPHLKDFRERIKINGQEISKQFVVDYSLKTMELAKEVQPSFFELTVGMAFDYFAQEKVDIAIIETGLGGRLDSTNIIQPLLSVITNIAYDHMDILGDTLEKIAFEKAGIIKPNTPVLIGEAIAATKPVFLLKAESQNSPIYFSEEILSIAESQYFIDHLDVSYRHLKTNEIQSFSLDLNGAYQSKNARTVCCAVELLKGLGFELDADKTMGALRQTKKLTGLKGRWQVLQQKPLLVADVAHNEDGIKQVLQQIDVAQIDTAQVHFVMGMVKDKDVEKVLTIMPKNAHYYFTQAHIPRALDKNILLEKAKTVGLNGDIFENVNAAITAAKAKAEDESVIIVCGSVFLIGEMDEL